MLDRMMARAVRWTAALAAVFVLGAPAALAVAPVAAPQTRNDPEAVLQRAQQSVVRVSIIQQSPEGLSLVSFGSGFVVAPNMVMTNFHVVEGARQRSDMVVFVTPAEGVGRQGVPGEVVWEWADGDLALIQTQNLPSPAIPLATSLPGMTAPVRALGYPAAVCRMLSCSADEVVAPASPYQTQGVVAQLAPRNMNGAPIPTIFHDAPISPGNSGGPLIDACGRVIGVNTWTAGAQVDQQGQIQSAEGMHVATHTRALLHFLQRTQTPFQAQETPCRLGVGGQEVEARMQQAETRLEQMHREYQLELQRQRIESDREMAGFRAAAGGALIVLGLAGLVGAGFMLSRSLKKDPNGRTHSPAGAAVALVIAVASLVAIGTGAVLMLGGGEEGPPGAAPPPAEGGPERVGGGPASAAP